MQQWVFQEGGLFFDIVGFCLIVWEWWASHREARRAIARNSLRNYLSSLRQEKEEEQRNAILRRMKQEAYYVGRDRELVLQMTKWISEASADETEKWSIADRSLAAGTEVDAAFTHRRRIRWMAFGVALVVLGFVGQSIGSWPNGVRPIACSTTNPTHLWCSSPNSVRAGYLG